jgi:hypothetical protein
MANAKILFPARSAFRHWVCGRCFSWRPDPLRRGPGSCWRHHVEARPSLVDRVEDRASRAATSPVDTTLEDRTELVEVHGPPQRGPVVSWLHQGIELVRKAEEGTGGCRPPMPLGGWGLEYNTACSVPRGNSAIGSLRQFGFDTCTGSGQFMVGPASPRARTDRARRSHYAGLSRTLPDASRNEMGGCGNA